MTLPTVCTISLAGVLLLTGCSDHAQWAQSRMAELGDGVSVVSQAATETAKPVPSAPAQPKPTLDRLDVADEPRVDVTADLDVGRLVIARGVEGREPVDPADSFNQAEAKRIYAFVEVRNRDRVASEIYVSFVKDGAPANAGVRLRVGASSRWRTWAYTRLATQPGRWRVTVRSGSGEELASKAFEITEAPQAANSGRSRSVGLCLGPSVARRCHGSSNPLSRAYS